MIEAAWKLKNPNYRNGVEADDWEEWSGPREGPNFLAWQAGRHEREKRKKMAAIRRRSSEINDRLKRHRKSTKKRRQANKVARRMRRFG